jgi:hypothetical protein
MIYIYIEETDIEQYSKIIGPEWCTDSINYYTDREKENLVMVSLNIGDFIGLTDRNKLQKISLLTN